MGRPRRATSPGAKPRPATRRRLIEVAADLFLRRGYEATGVAEILARAGVGAGSFYYHFDSKEELLLAVLDHYAEIFPEVIEGPAREETDDPLERIFAILAGYRRYLVDNDFELGCPIGNLALEVGSRLPAAGARTAHLFELWRGAVLAALEEAGPRLPDDLDRPGLASLVLTVMEGGLMQARAERSVEPFDASVAQLKDYVDRLAEQQAGRRSEDAAAGRLEDLTAGETGRPRDGRQKGEQPWQQDSWKVW